ncbi:DUF6508 domain-containing protein [Desulfosporosinus sp. Sb-LF]|uniref:DUF6508 domain-containing protein n=1 Tax=Desulfosporosinus sp. Sb-LF TaxID=2560027 RepID=UPI0018EEC491|nr:DUF6508 domain-containing protein [Desulfosporosinus sp. Sb-LF]
MNKHELNKYAISLAEKSFQDRGFKIEDALPAAQVDFLAVLSSSKRMKIKVRAISQLGSYVFIPKRKFNIEDPDLYMVVQYIPHENNERIMYIIPATEWGKDIYPFKGKDYDKPGQVSEPEWGISFSGKAKDAMEPYRFTKYVMKLLADEDCRRLVSHINYFENNTKFYDVDEGGMHNNVIQLPCYHYNEGFINFIDDFYKSSLSEPNYLELIQPYLDKKLNLNDLIKSADYNLLRVIFTFNVRGEHFCDGFWAGALENKTFLNILYRLKELIE